MLRNRAGPPFPRKLCFAIAPSPTILRVDKADGAFAGIVAVHAGYVQYACGDYTDLLKAHGIVASMSRIHPYDNAKGRELYEDAQALKQEEIDGRSYRDPRHARRHSGSFIEQVYNHHRLHSALD